MLIHQVKGKEGVRPIELLITVAIPGVMTAVVIPHVGRFIGSGEEEAANTELSTVQSAVQSLMVDEMVKNFTGLAYVSDIVV